jgi:hypothetical protein
MAFYFSLLSLSLYSLKNPSIHLKDLNPILISDWDSK